MNRRAFGISAAASLALAGCSTTGSTVSRFKTYDGPQVTSIVINKGARKLYLMHNDEILREYGVDLGFAPLGPKRFVDVGPFRMPVASMARRQVLPGRSATARRTSDSVRRPIGIRQ